MGRRSPRSSAVIPRGFAQPVVVEENIVEAARKEQAVRAWNLVERIKSTSGDWVAYYRRSVAAGRRLVWVGPAGRGESIQSARPPVKPEPRCMES